MKKENWSRTKSILSKVAPWLAALVTAGLIVGLVVMCPISWLPKTSEAGTLLGTLLTAQAAVAALTLAVTLFLMQGASARRDVDDRVYREYVRRSWMRQIFWSSLLAVGTTGVVLLVESFIGEIKAVSEWIPSLRNLTILAVLAFLANLVLAVVLFERAIRLAHPEHWWTIRRYVNERDVREALEVFLGRRQRALAARTSGQSDITLVIPDPGEGSAKEAIQALLDDARRAIEERQQREFTRSLDSIKELILYAMNEIENSGVSWGEPGSQPHWPPLRELGRNLHSLREEVIRRGERDQVTELLGFDYWALRSGMSRGCGELFTVGLAGYRSNYEVAIRLADKELLERFGEQLWQDLHLLAYNVTAIEAYPFFSQMVSHQEQLLHLAMRSDRPSEYERLHKGFENFLRNSGRYRQLDSGSLREAEEVSVRLDQHYRITLMGLGGRAVLLAEAGRVADGGPYLEVVRGKHVRLENLASDLAQALAREEVQEKPLWSDWEMEGALNFETRGVYPERYPLTWFAIRLMELAAEPLTAMDLHGHAQRVLEWFKANSERLATYVRGISAQRIEEGQRLATDALLGAVHRDEIAEDLEIIRRELSADRVSAFVSDVYASEFATNPIFRLLDQAGAILHLSMDADGHPDEWGIHDFAPKGFLAEMPEGARTQYAQLRGNEWGESLANGVTQIFCAALSEAPSLEASLTSPTSLLEAIDEAARDLNVLGELIVVLTGDWMDAIFELDREDIDGYESLWRIPETERVGEIARYANPVSQQS